MSLGFPGAAFSRSVEDAVEFFKHPSPFPKKVICPICYKWNKVTQPGFLCCVKCETGLEIDNKGHAFPEPD